MYSNNKKFQHLTNGALVIMLLLGSNAMAEESLPQVTDNLQRMVVESLSSQLQQSSEALITIEPVQVAPAAEWPRGMEIPHAESPARLAEDNPSSLQFTLQNWQPQQSTAKYLGQVEG